MKFMVVKRNINVPPAHMSQIGETIYSHIFFIKTVKGKPTLNLNLNLRKFKLSMMMDLNILKLLITKYTEEVSH